MADSLTLLFRIQADGTGATEAIQSVADSLNSLTPAANNAKTSTEGTTTSVTNLGASSDAVSKTIQGNLNASLTNLAAQGGTTTSIIAQLGSALGGLMNPLGALTVAIAATGGAIVALGVNFANAGSRIHDLSRVTGLSEDALSGLEVAARRGGGSLEQLTGAFVRFQRQAVDGSDEVKQAFAAFGITAEEAALDSEAAFDKFLIGFNEMGEGAERTALLIKLFGRAGAQLIPTLEEAGGGLEELTRQAREMGTAFDRNAADSADRLGDSIDDLKATMEGLLLNAARPLIPVLQDIVTLMLELKVVIPVVTALVHAQVGVWKSIASPLIATADAIRTVIAGIQVLRGTKIELPESPQLKTGIKNFEILQNLIRTGNKEGKVFPQKPAGGGGGGDKDITDAELRLKDLARLAEEAARIRDEDLEIARRAATEIPSAMSDAHAKSIAAEETYLQKMLALLNEQRKIINETITLPNKRKDALADLAIEEGKIIDDANKRIQELHVKNQKIADDIVSSDVKIAQASRDLMAEQTKLAAARLSQIKTEHDALLALQFTEEEIIAARASSHTAAVKQAKTQAEEERRVREDAQKKQEADSTSMASIFGIEDPFGEAGIVEGVFGAMKGGLEDLSASFGSFRQFAAGAMSAVAQAAQQMLSAFILTGKGGGAAFKKLTADILAALVVQSAVKAIFELAEGFAAAAVGDVRGAAKHFAAAKLYALVAAGAGVVAAGIGAAGGLGGGGRKVCGGR